MGRLSGILEKLIYLNIVAVRLGQSGKKQMLLQAEL